MDQELIRIIKNVNNHMQWKYNIPRFMELVDKLNDDNNII